MKEETSAGIVIYRRTQEGIRYLLLYHGGRYWNFPKGHIEFIEGPSREKNLEAALRETAEETGLKRQDLLIDSSFRAIEKYSFTKKGTRISKTVIFFLAESKQRNITISHEHEGFGWFLYKDAHQLLSHYKDGIELLQKARWFIAGRERKRNQKMVPPHIDTIQE